MSDRYTKRDLTSLIDSCNQDLKRMGSKYKLEYSPRYNYQAVDSTINDGITTSSVCTGTFKTCHKDVKFWFNLELARHVWIVIELTTNRIVKVSHYYTNRIDQEDMSQYLQKHYVDGDLVATL